MKVTITIDGHEETLRTVRVGDWSFRQSDEVCALTTSRRHPLGILPGDVQTLIALADPAAALAFGIVAYMLAGRDPSPLPDMSIESIVVDLSEDDVDPPAEGAPEGAATKKPAARGRRGARSAPKS